MSLKRFLTDRRVPAADRDRLPVVASGSTVFWVEGHEVDGCGTSFYATTPRGPSFDVQNARAAFTMKVPYSGGELMGREPGRAAK
jgi:hypothetical protein